MRGREPRSPGREVIGGWAAPRPDRAGVAADRARAYAYGYDHGLRSGLTTVTRATPVPVRGSRRLSA